MSGEQAAQIAAQLYPNWYTSLIRYAARVTGSVELARDLVQESFLLLAQELSTGKTVNSPKAWTLRVVRHQISKQLSREKDRGIVFESIDADPRWGEFVPPALRVDPRLPQDDLTRFLSALSVREEEALLLRLEGYRYAEIAEALGVTAGTVKTLLARSLKKVQAAAGIGTQSPARTKEWTDE